jgi:hypothetical protein
VLCVYIADGVVAPLRQGAAAANSNAANAAFILCKTLKRIGNTNMMKFVFGLALESGNYCVNSMTRYTGNDQIY